MAVEATTLDVADRAALLGRGRGDSRGRFDIRSHGGTAAVVAVPLIGLLICMGATRSPVLLPETAALDPLSVAGPLRFIGFDMPAWVAIGVITLLFVLYVVAARLAERVPTRAVIGAVIAFNLIVLIGPPLFSTDVFSYQAYARMFTTYHTNPYTHGVWNIELDPIYHFVGAKWIFTPSVYGPLFTLASGALARTSILFSEFTFKIVAALASLGTLALIWKAAELRKVNRNRAIAVFGLNPLIILYGVGGGHNDLLMLLFTTAGIYLLLLRKELSGGGAILIGAAIKLTGALVFPFALVAGRGTDGVGRRRLRVLIGAGLATIVVAIPSFIVFGSGLLHMTTTLQSVQRQGQWQSVPGFFLNLAGSTENTRPVSLGLSAIFALICLWLLWRVWQGRMDWLEGAGWATFAILMTAGSVLPWYVAWLFPLVALTSSRRLWHAAMWMTAIATFMTVVTYVPGGYPF